MNEKQSMLESLEWHLIPSGDTFYDDLERCIFINGSTKSIKLGFGHDIRKRETILITLEKEEIADPKLKAFEGEIIEEEV
jgi:hypothetical protein